MSDKQGRVNYWITYCGYAFTVDEMHAEVRARREEARRVREMGEAALDLNKLLETNLARVVAINDYYHLVWKPSMIARVSAASP